MYRPEFDMKRPQPGDKDLAEAIRKGVELAKKTAEEKATSGLDKTGGSPPPCGSSASR